MKLIFFLQTLENCEQITVPYILRTQIYFDTKARKYAFYTFDFSKQNSDEMQLILTCKTSQIIFLSEVILRKFLPE